METTIIQDTVLECGHAAVPKPIGGTGYAETSNGARICYACCAQRDRETMIVEGTSGGLPLYLSQRPADGRWMVGNWPGTLSFPVSYHSKSRHNIATTRYDVWFNGPDGYLWHGSLYGENTLIVHCKRTRTKT